MKQTFEFYFRKKNFMKQKLLKTMKNKSQVISDMAAFSIKRKPLVSAILTLT